MILKNTKEVNLMLWELNPSKRNINNIITFVAKNSQDVNNEDVISSGTREMPSFYFLKNITSKRPASLSNYTHYTAETVWSNK